MMFCLGSKTTVRPARIHDIPRLLELGEQMRLESEVYFPPIDKEFAWNSARTIIENNRDFFAFVVEDRDGVFGWIHGHASTTIFSPSRIAVHDIFYVSPEKRKERPFAAWRLIREYLRWAKGAADRAIIRVDTNIHPERTAKLYRRFGFEPMGGQFIRDV